MIITILLSWYLAFGVGYYLGKGIKPKHFFLKAAVVVLWPFASSFLKDTQILTEPSKKDGGQPQQAA